MYAIVDIAGQQFKVEKDQKIYVHRLDGDEGSKVDFDQVLLVDNDGKVQVGAPVIKDTIVTASIVSHLQGDKVKVFKKKRRKGYQVMNGHRQQLTELLIESIGAGKAKAAPQEKAEVASKETKSEKAAEKSTSAPKAAAKPAAKVKAEPAEKKPAAKKPAANKATAAKTTEKKAAAKPAAKPAAKKAAPKAKKAEEKKKDE